MTVNGESLRVALAETAAEHGPGLYGLVTEPGAPGSASGSVTVFADSVGIANLDRTRPLEAGDRFRIGSLTKTYVATLVLQLVADGVLALDDTVEKLLPGLVPSGDRITVEVLLRLRSGLPDYTTALYGNPPTDLSALSRYWSPRQLVAAALSADDRLEPDSAHRYCNLDYILLGMMIEASTGERVDAQMWQRIFKPLDLRDTTFPTVDPYLRGPHADGHIRLGPGRPYFEFTTMSPSEGWTAGAIEATAGDVAAFLDGLFGGALLPERYLAQMIEPTQRIDAQRGFGLGVMRYDFGYGPDKVAYGFTGGVPGFSTLALRTVSGRCVVVWQNGIDLHNILTTDCVFLQAALRA